MRRDLASWILIAVLAALLGGLWVRGPASPRTSGAEPETWTGVRGIGAEP